jgi:hypothetical protein
MEDVLTHNFVGKTYEYVESKIHEITGIPNNKKWDTLNKRPFLGSVNKQQEDYVFQASLFTMRDNRTIDDIRDNFKNFRSADYLGNIFITDKPLYGYKYNDTVIFETSAYEESTHNNNLKMFELLSKAFQDNSRIVKIHSIVKSRHDYDSTTRRFYRDYIALLVIQRV